jgi:cytochrome P450
MQIRGEENKHLFVSVGEKNLAFGYGRHICPGRYVAHIIIMLMMAEVLLNYDVKNHEGQGRPKNVEVGPMVLLLSGLTLSTMG